MFYIFLCAIWTHLIPLSIDAQCTFPDSLSGAWTSTDKGSLTFTSTTLSGYPTTKFGSLDFTCDSNEGDFYVAKSSWFSYHGIIFEAYLCLRFTSYATYAYTYYLGSTPDAFANNERFKSAANGSALTVTEVCDRGSYDDGAYSLLVKDGSGAAVATDCPSILQNTYTYTYTDGSSTYCSTNSSLDVCANTTALVFDYTKCSQQVLYSASGILSCMFSKTSGSNTYVSLYNHDATVDDSTTYRYVCLVVTQSGTSRSITQYPTECTTPGSSLELTFDEKCPTASAEEVSSAFIALAVLVPLVLIVVTVMVCYFCWSKYQKKQIKENARPDPKYAQGEIANKKLCPLHDGVTFASDANDNLIKREDPKFSNKLITREDSEVSNKLIKRKDSDMGNKLVKHKDSEVKNKSMKREDSVVSNGIGVRREESIVISLPSSSRGGKRPMTEESIQEDPEHSLNEEPGSDDERYEVRDITELIPGSKIDVPKVTISEATEESEGDVINGEEKKDKKKKFKLKRKKSAKVRFKRSITRRKSAKVRNIPSSADAKDMNENENQSKKENQKAANESAKDTTLNTPIIKTNVASSSNSPSTANTEINELEPVTCDLLPPRALTTVQSRIKSGKRPGSSKSTASVEEQKKGQGALSYGTKTLVLKLKQRTPSAKQRKGTEEDTIPETERENDESVAQIQVQTKENVSIDIDSIVTPRKENDTSLNKQEVHKDGYNDYIQQSEPNELLTERLDDNQRRDKFHFESEVGPSSAKERRGTLRDEAYKLRPISEQDEKKRNAAERKRSMPVLNTHRYVRQNATPEEKAKISRAWSRTRTPKTPATPKKGKIGIHENKEETPTRGMDTDLDVMSEGPDEEAEPDQNGELPNRGKYYKPKPFMEPRPDTPEDMWEKISGLWHLGFQWIGNTPLGTKPSTS